MCICTYIDVCAKSLLIDLSIYTERGSEQQQGWYVSLHRTWKCVCGLLVTQERQVLHTHSGHVWWTWPMLFLSTLNPVVPERSDSQLSLHPFGYWKVLPCLPRYLWERDGGRDVMAEAMG